MNFARTLLWVVLMFLTSAAQSQPTTPSSVGPDQLTRDGAPGPFFISARQATDTDGNVRWSVFDEGTRTVLRGRVDAERPRTVNASGASATGSSPCAVAAISPSHLPAPARSLNDLITNAGAIYRGVVTDLTPGFELVRPVTLVGIDIGKLLRAGPGFPRSGRILVIHPYADFMIGSTRFCNAASEASAPHIGDHVILFAYVAPTDTSHSFLLTTSEQLFSERDHKLMVPQYLHDPTISATTLEELEREIGNARPRHEAGRPQ